MITNSNILVADEYKKQWLEYPVEKAAVNGLADISILKQAAITAVAAESAAAFDSSSLLKKIMH